MKYEKEGVVQAHTRGFGFAVTESDERVFLPPPLMRKLMPGDRIGFTPVPGRMEGDFEARAAWLIHRPSQVVLGTAVITGNRTVLEPDEPFFVTLQLPSSEALDPKDVLVVKLTEFTPAAPLFAADLPGLLQVETSGNLGQRDSDGFDRRYALAKFRFAAEFPDAVIAECTNFVVPGTDELARDPARMDLRHLPFVTVDSATTQDFDDALYAERLTHGWRVLVAIADVSYYVQADSALDKEARKRATSVYLPGQTAPMLPKQLSDGLCALKAHQPRLSLVADMEVNEDGTLKSTAVYRALIEVADNLTYDWLFDVMNDQAPAPQAYRSCLEGLTGLYRKLTANKGTLVNQLNEMPEPYLKDGKVSWSTRNDAHKLVEAYMLMANQEVAKIMAARSVNMLFRHQSQPDADRWAELREWAVSIGKELPEAPTKEALDEFMGSLSAGQQFTATLQVRGVMNSATYDKDKSSHFSLGYDAYTHFSSPIRRYADLVVHRLLLGDNFSQEELSAVAAQCSERSRAARSAERFVWDKIKKRYLQANLAGTQLCAYVISQSKFGARAVLLPWQCAISLSGSDLQAQGLSYDSTQEKWGGESLVLDLGTLMTVDTFELEEYKARTDLKATVRSLAGVLPDLVAS